MIATIATRIMPSFACLHAVIAASRLTGMTAQAVSASVQVTRGRADRRLYWQPAGITGSFSTNFSRSAKDCSSPQGPDHVRAAPQLHRRPDLAVGIEHISDRDGQDGEEQQDRRSNG